MSWALAALLALPCTAAADEREARCAPEVALSLTEQELAQADFEPGGITPALLAFFAGPRIALEWNDGRGVRTIELLRSVPYLGNAVAAQLDAKVRRRGEVQYAEVSGGRSPLPLFTAWTTARAGVDGDDWQTLTSNGVLEDELLAALTAELARAASHGGGS